LTPIVKLRVGHFALSRLLLLRCNAFVPDHFRTILGVRFYISDLEPLLDLVPQGGLIVAPSAPVMVRLEEDPAHRDAMEGADLAITDSAYMVLLWLMATGERVRRISGLRLLRGIIGRGQYRAQGESFWIMPTETDKAANFAWLQTQGFEVSGDQAYTAPLYPKQGPIADPDLVAAIDKIRPKLIVIALSGGVQERLGWHLRRQLHYMPTILCIGGAIAFLSGRQTRIPVWADRLALGWLFRFIADPGGFSAKVSGVGRLAPLIWKHRTRSVASPL
jgi:UDP-N-acetyl-D-mannosaminuronic acid transferase (WecB/TagA/CpsF family)